MTKTYTIKTINGADYTVVWHGEQLWCKSDAVWNKLVNGSLVLIYDGYHIATTLPALPRHPKPEDAPLLYRYMSEGLRLHFHNEDGKFYESGPDGIESVEAGDVVQILHVTDSEGNRIEIAIKDD